jgi:hypothetical protein
LSEVGTGAAVSLTLDDVSKMMLGLLLATQANEPALVHPDDPLYVEQARLHDRWEQQFYATQLMLGIRLVGQLTEGTR